MKNHDDETRAKPVGEALLEAEVRELAEEFCALLADGRSTNLHLYLSQFETEHERKLFEEFVESGRVGISAVQDTSQPRRILNERYRLDVEIGAGGMGRVFRAWDLELERSVAVKVLSLVDVGDTEREQLLIKESKILATLHHPNIVSVYETGRDGELVYVVMELIDGESLAKVIERIQMHESFAERRGQERAKGADVIRMAINRPLAEGWVDQLDSTSYSRSVSKVMLQVVRTIEAAHAANVVHRDLKPSNIMLVGGANPVVLDFGLAGQTELAAGAITQGLYGTVAYLAPEQAQSQKVGADRRTDVYQLGLLLYEFLTLKRAFPDGAIGEVLERIKRGDFVEPRKLRKEIPRDLAAICLKALEVSPGNRYQSASELREDLECFLSQERIPTAVKGSASRAAMRHTRIAVRRHALAFALISTLLVATLAWWGASGETEALSLEPFAMGTEMLRAIGPGSTVFPTESLGYRIESSKPRTVYSLSLFADREEEELLCVRPVVPLETRSEVVRAGRWGVKIGEGESQLLCARVEDSNAKEGLMFFVTEQPSALIEGWFDRLQSEADSRMEGVISWEDAELELRGLIAGTGSRGAGLTAPSVEERARWVKLAESYEKEQEAFWPSLGITLERLECIVKGSPEGE